MDLTVLWRTCITSKIKKQKIKKQKTKNNKQQKKKHMQVNNSNNGNKYDFISKYNNNTTLLTEITSKKVVLW